MTVVLDTSAIVAVILGEPDAEAMVSVMLANAGDLQVSAATMVETGIVVESKQGRGASTDLRALLQRLSPTIAPVDQKQADLAVAAWRRFGKGRHPAGLNLGDCFSYALAKVLGSPLLFTGGDFAQTDISAAI